MKALMLTAMMLCACLFVPGCFGGEQEEILCEDGGEMTQFDVLICYFEILNTPEGEECGGPDGELTGENLCYGTIRIEMTNTGDSPVHILTSIWWEEEAWLDCEPISLEDGLFEFDSMGTTLEAAALPGSFFVAFDHPNSCDEEDDSTPVADISYKVSLVT